MNTSQLKHCAFKSAVFAICLIYSWHGSGALGNDTGLKGTVVNAAGEPIANAAIELPDYSGEAMGKTASDSNGNFALDIPQEHVERLFRRSPSLQILVPGFGAAYIDCRRITAFSGRYRDLGKVVVDQGLIYSGRVVDIEGKPIAGAKVTTVCYRHRMGHTVETVGKESVCFTDHEGQYVTERIPIGEPSITATAPGYVLDGLKREAFTEKTTMELPDLVLDKDVPVTGTVVFQDGKPASGVSITANGRVFESGSNGEFVLSGFKRDTTFQLQINLPGYRFVNLGVVHKGQSYEYYDVREASQIDRTQDAKKYQLAFDAITQKVDSLRIELEASETIHGRVVDAETGAPIPVSQVVLCTFTRRKDGEVILNGCRAGQFRQPKIGEFEIDYTVPLEYHLTVSAPGYEDGEAFTPPIASLRPIGGIVVKLRRLAGEAEDAGSLKQRIEGVVSGVDESARVALWRRPVPRNSLNAYLIRGRTTPGDGYVYGSSKIESGKFRLDVPFKDSDWFVLVESVDGVVALKGPFSIEKGARETVDIVASELCSVSGRVRKQRAFEFPLFVVMFSKLGVQYECRVSAAGDFEFTNVLPGEYGVKVGSDAVRDSEVMDVNYEAPLEERLKVSNTPSDPWKRATKIYLDPGESKANVQLKYTP